MSLPHGHDLGAAAEHAEVNHPPHYQAGGLEAIDVIEAFSLSFLLGNTVKYVLRSGRKKGADSLTDLRKAQWYLARAIANAERGK